MRGLRWSFTLLCLGALFALLGGCEGEARDETAGTGDALASNGLLGQYFSDGALGQLAFTRTDATLNFNWASGSPGTGVGADNFSVRWTGQLTAQFSERYTFSSLSDDGIRVWVDGQQLINDWTDHAARTDSGSITLAAGQKYDLKVEYYERGGLAQAQLSWSSPSQAKQVIPSRALTPPGSCGQGALAQVNGGGAAVGSFFADVAGGGFSGGVAWTGAGAAVDVSGVAEAAPAAVYTSYHYGFSGPFSFQRTLAPGGSYQARLHFAEVYAPDMKTGGRLFDVAINGAAVLSNFDVWANAGGNRALVKDFPATADASGNVTVTFTPISGHDSAMVSAVELFAASTCTGGGGTPDAGTPDAGTGTSPDAGTGTPDAGSPGSGGGGPGAVGFGNSPPTANGAGAVLTVGAGKQYGTVQAALDAATGGSAGTPRLIAVYDGDYRETIRPSHSHVKVMGQSLATRLLGSNRISGTWTNAGGNVWKLAANPHLAYSAGAYGRTSYFSDLDGSSSPIRNIHHQDMNQLFRDYGTWCFNRNALSDVTADGDYYLDYGSQLLYVYSSANPNTAHVYDLAARNRVIDWGLGTTNAEDTEYTGLFIGHAAAPFSGAAVWLGRQDKLTDATVLGSSGRGVNTSILNVIKGSAAPYTGTPYTFAAGTVSTQQGRTGTMRILYAGNTALAGAPSVQGYADATGTNTNPTSESFSYQNTFHQVEIAYGNYLLNSVGDEGGTVKFAYQSSIQFTGNWVHDSLGVGLWLDNQNVGWTITDNLFERTMAGFNFEANFQKPSFSSVVDMHHNTVRQSGTSWNGSIDLNQVGGYFDHSALYCTAYRGIVVKDLYVNMTPWAAGHAGAAVTTRGDDGRYTGSTASSFTNIQVDAPAGQELFVQGGDPLIDDNAYRVGNTAAVMFAVYGTADWAAWRNANGHSPKPDAHSSLGPLP